ncbi:MAG TPA: Clp protease N-terminal domain-containing protein [Streptosporangiaceae bacterium]|nr:Clp protease N-terminal domain-containing protein [Streptosporangiaceae bacterium]
MPFTPVAKRILELTLRETLQLHDSTIGVEHIALALTVVKRGMVPLILAGADTSAPTLHAEIVDQYRQAS